MLKVIHSADIHLDSPFRMEDLRKAQARKNELKAAFSSLILWAKTVKADILIIAGDLFDSREPSRDTAEYVASQFASFPECKFIITPGNHDFYSPNSVYAKMTFPDNVVIFKSEELECTSFDIAGEKVNIYGYAFCSPIMEKNPFAHFKVTDSGSINILVAHGTLSSDSGKDCPIKLEDIASSGFDYVALGHIHNSPEIKKINSTYYGYSGSLEPRAFNDLGERGAFISEMSKKDSSFTCNTSFFRLSKRVYAVDKINVTNKTDGELVALLQAIIKKKGYSSDTLVRWIFEGELTPSTELPIDKINSLAQGFYHLEIKNLTTSTYDIEALKKDPTIKGELARVLEKSLTSENDEEKKLSSDAMKYALSALGGKNIIDF